MEIEVGKYYKKDRVNSGDYCLVTKINDGFITYTRYVNGIKRPIQYSFSKKEFLSFYPTLCQKRNNALYKLLND